jgi:hypothetical protein
MTPELAQQKKRMLTMGVINLVAVIAALAASVAYFKFALGWALILFFVAVVAGFGAQIWFIAGFRRKGA